MMNIPIIQVFVLFWVCVLLWVIIEYIVYRSQKRGH